MSTAARFPFSAVVGHDDLRLALLLNAVHPGVGGVLVRGEKGTAKSTAVRAVAGLLPRQAVVVGCRFSCDPVRADPDCPDGPHPAGTSSEHRPAAHVELPVGATEDRLLGSLDLERALAEGVRAYQPGLLADAHRGVLYVDEVNLLHDHLVDLLLDAAAMGRAHVERDGVSVSHAARFMLVGTMNPEEGELRPQLLDRFGLTVDVRAARDVETRVEVVRRRLGFEADPAGFARAWRDAETRTAARIEVAQAALGSVRLDDRELRRIAAVCAAFDVDGMRADLVIARAAAAHAAWRGAGAVAEEDVRVAARLALPHRRRRDPFDQPGIDEQALDDVLRSAAEQAGPEPEGAGADRTGSGGPGRGGAGADGGGPGGGGRDGGGPDGGGSDGGGPDGGGSDGGGRDGGGGPGDSPGDSPGGDAPKGTFGSRSEPTGTFGPQWGGHRTPAVPEDGSAGPPPLAPKGTSGTQGESNGTFGARPCADGPTRAAPPPSTAFRARRLEVPGLGDGVPGRRSRARTDLGRVVRPSDESPRRAADLHVPATITAAAPHQRSRGRTGAGLRLRRDDLRRAVREGREANLVLFVVDASGSMGARSRMGAVSGAVLSLLRDAYQRRDKVGLVTFRAAGAELVLPPTSSVPAAQARLAALRTGGRTPLAEGLLRARRTLAAERVRDPRRRPLLVLLTDGRATVPARPGGDPVVDACRAAGLLAGDGVHTVVVDCESGPVRLGLAARVAVAAGGPLVGLDELSADRVVGVVRAVGA